MSPCPKKRTRRADPSADVKDLMAEVATLLEAEADPNVLAAVISRNDQIAASHAELVDEDNEE